MHNYLLKADTALKMRMLKPCALIELTRISGGLLMANSPVRHPTLRLKKVVRDRQM